MVTIYLVLFFIGWINVYSAVHSEETMSIFSLGARSGKQFIWFGMSVITAAVIVFALNPRTYEGIAFPLYLLFLILLIAVIFLGTKVNGSRSWFELGLFRFQPAEVSKISTSLLLARIMSQYGFRLRKMRDFIMAAIVVLLPMLIIVLQNETGSALVYVGFLFVFYREGLSGWILFMVGMAILLFILTLTASPFTAVLVLLIVVTIYNSLYLNEMRHWWMVYFPSLLFLSFIPKIFGKLSGISENVALIIEKIDPVYILIAISAIIIPFILVDAYKRYKPFTVLAVASLIAGVILVFSTDILFDKVLQDHQRQRIEVLLGMKEDPSGVGYNVNQSMIAIGSGGFAGKGYMNGTQTTYGFVPEQSTDFIFCTIGEEWGFLGTTFVILLFVFLIGRIIVTAEQSYEAFTRIYGYCVASCFFMHLFINIGMTIGLMPVIGIPLPFVSYGGSSLFSFTVLLFIYIALRRNESKR